MTATTIAELPQTAHIYVRADGRGDYATIQEAVLSVPENNQIPTVIHLAPGVYHEEVVVSGARPLVTIVGEDPLTTEISYGRYAGMMWENGDPTTTFRTATFTPTIFAWKMWGYETAMTVARAADARRSRYMRRASTTFTATAVFTAGRIRFTAATALIILSAVILTGTWTLFLAERERFFISVRYTVKIRIRKTARRRGILRRPVRRRPSASALFLWSVTLPAIWRTA